ncbi:MAG: hypothetical protein EXR67_07375 [Dehalococcoidia bacterium]|nr:hypothetical protein [Dehalococcoidia bacterium]
MPSNPLPHNAPFALTARHPSIGIATNPVYPKWTGWFLIVSGVVAAAAAGCYLIYEGAGVTSQMVFAVAALVLSLLSLVLGVLMTQRQMKEM